MRFAQVLAALDARTNYERSGRLVAPTLARMEALMDVMAHPEQSFSAIHITGTNGKTTTARAATEVLRAAGLHVATYISPHVESILERFSYDGVAMTQDEFVEAWRELAPFLDLIDARGEQVTWFEAATALAFTWFADKAVDVAVIEVGMGGTWDATNVIDAPTAVISRIDVDHAHVLGATPAEIAREKAGIIKPGAIVFMAEQEADVADVLRARCAEAEAEMRAEGIAFEVERSRLALGGQSLSFRIEHDRYTDVFLPMFGEQFAHDAVLGAAAARAMLGGRTIEADVMHEAFANIMVPGRMEVVHRSPLAVLDGAHNPAAARALATSMPSAFKFDRLWLVVGMLGDKDVDGALEHLLPLADEVICTRPAAERAISAEDLAERARAAGKEPIVVQNVADAISVAIERAEDSDCILVTGSLYTVGEARTSFLSKEST
ncbi:MAG TPA: folylpolyglutamate synthase/dihydrofolate synthase family protein [Actinomycetota bacterium]|nr:folylpolyglutamate synthase/dihydrofolate synthase family protein [Actinomycetota bacterium]